MQIKLCLCCMYSKAYEIKFFEREFVHILSWQWTWKFLMWDNLNNMRNVMNILCYLKDMVNNNCPYLFCLSILWPYHMGHTHNSLCRIVHRILLGILARSCFRKYQECMLVMKYDYILSDPFWQQTILYLSWNTDF